MSLVRAVILLCVSLALLTVAVAAGLTRSTDLALLDASQSLASPSLDVVSSLASATGGVVVTSAVAILLTLVLVRRGGWLAATPLLMFAGVALESLAKRVIVDPAPPIALLRDYHWLAISGADSGGGNSFPSGHLLRTTFLALVAGARWPHAWAGPIVLIAVMALTRVYSASHWASDVLGGVLVGALLFIAAVAIDRIRIGRA